MRIVFPSTQVSFLSLIYRATLSSTIEALYDQLDFQAAVVSDCLSLEEAFHNQKLQIDRLLAKLRSYVDIAPRLADYAQERYIRLWSDQQNLIWRLRKFQTELGRRASQDGENRALETELFEANAALGLEQDRRIHESTIA